MAKQDIPEILAAMRERMARQAEARSAAAQRKRRIHLSTAENVAKLFEQDWVILVGSKDGEVHFVPWLSANTPEQALAEWLALLADERKRRQPPSDQQSLVTKGH